MRAVHFQRWVSSLAVQSRKAEFLVAIAPVHFVRVQGSKCEVWAAKMTEFDNHGEGSRPFGNMDAFESMFEWAETSFCPAAMRNYKPESKPDTLDYVFDHVESFTCRQEEKEPDVVYNRPMGLARDNSLLLPESSSGPTRKSNEPTIKPFGQRGDLVDYVFEHVESYACNEATPDDSTTLKTIFQSVPPKNVHRSSQYQAQSVNETEDEIQLYFRPQGGKRRRRRVAS